jgi:hypothetical protein
MLIKKAGGFFVPSTAPFLHIDERDCEEPAFYLERFGNVALHFVILVGQASQIGLEVLQVHLDL